MIRQCRFCKIYGENFAIASTTRSKHTDKFWIYYQCAECGTERMKRYRHTKRGNMIVKKIRKRYFKKHREEQKKRLNVHYRIKIGKLVRPTQCSRCSGQSKYIDAHHIGYEDAENIIWLCRKCHSKEHKHLLKTRIIC